MLQKDFNQKLILKLSRYLWNISLVSGFVSLSIGVILFAFSQEQYVMIHNFLYRRNSILIFWNIDNYYRRIGKESERLDKQVQALFNREGCRERSFLYSIELNKCNLGIKELKKVALINKKHQQIINDSKKYAEFIENQAQSRRNTYSPYLIESMYLERKSESYKLIGFGLTLIALSSLPSGILYFIEKNAKD